MENKFDLDKHVINEMKKTRKFWTMPKKNKLHWIVSLIISQGIPFEQGRIIRIKLYEKLNKYDLDYDTLIKMTDDDWNEIMTNKFKIKCIKNVLKLGKDPSIEELEQINGIGPWTIKAIKLQCYNFDDIFLEEDYWIRKKLKEIYDLNSVPDVKGACKISQRWNENMRSDISRFLWRLKTEGSITLRNGDNLDKIHFLPLPK